MAGVYRPYPRVPWLRHRRVLVASPPAPTPETGTTDLVLTGAGAATKVVSVSGSTSIGLSASGRASKVIAKAGSSPVAVGGTSTPRKVATPLSAGSVGITATGLGVKRALPNSVGVLGLVGTQSGTVVRGQFGQTALGLTGSGHASKVIAVAGSGSLSVVGTGTARKVTTSTSTTALGLTGQGAATKVAPGTGIVVVAVSGQSTPIKDATPLAQATIGLSGYQAGPLAHSAAGRSRLGVVGLARAAKQAMPTATTALGVHGRAGYAQKTAKQGGLSALALDSSTLSVLQVSTRGRARIGLTASGWASKRTAQSGRTALGIVGRSFSGITYGTRVSPPLALPENSIAGSLILWRATTPGTSTVMIETSVDNGATWQVATNGEPIPRLVEGTRSARSVITRQTLTRATSDDPTPRLHYLEVRVDLNASRAEYCPLGVFTLNDVVVDDSPNGLEIELSGADLSRRVSRNRWDKTYVIAAGTNYSQAIQLLINDRLQGLTFNFASTSRLTPRLFFGEQSENDPWDDAQKMAQSIGMELFFDARGVCTLRPEPDPEIDDSVWTFEDRSRPTMTSLTRRVTDENTYNKVVVTGEGTSLEVPVRGVAIDDDPASPTYFLGPYGTVTLRITNSLVLTTEQAQDAADAALRRVKGATEAVELDAVPMPALEPGDVVTVTRERAKVEGRFIIDSLRIPLGAEETMRAVGRRQRQ